MSKYRNRPFGAITPDKIQQRLDNDESIPSIARSLGCSDAAVSKYIKRNNLYSRRSSLRSSSVLNKMYIDEKLSMSEIAKLLGVTYQAVDYYLTKFEIPKRDICEIQSIATLKYRTASEVHLPTKDLKSRGYCFRHNGLWFASLAEFSYYIYLLKQGSEFKFQPFTFKHKRPDFLVENTVVEIKYFLPKEELSGYLEWGKEMQLNKGYNYVLIDFKNKPWKDLYQKIRALLPTKLERGITLDISDTLYKTIIENTFAINFM